MKKLAKISFTALAAGAIAVAITAGAMKINIENGKINAVIEYSPEQIPSVIVDDQGATEEITEIDGETIPTVEEVDGGLFEDITTGLSVTEGEYSDLGWAETYNVSTPEAFRNDTLGKCIYANNKFGAQCVSLARVFWWSYADRDVSTCGTGMAKGMMNCAEQNAGDDFLVYWAEDKPQIQAGDWLVFDGGQYGHVGMALGPIVNGYVALLGENQGGRACERGGAATNIININTKNLIGFYRPKAYIKPAPQPEPTPKPEPAYDDCTRIKVVWGDTMGAIMKRCEGEIKWGEAMDAYANSWVSEMTGQTVYYGWTHGTGYGLLAGDTITRV